MRMWEIREGYDRTGYKEKYSKEYECGYEDGYKAAVEEMQSEDREGYRYPDRIKRYR
jgi:flagellar biosynthesis/type III secretory pathway protein FliH